MRGKQNNKPMKKLTILSLLVVSLYSCQREVPVSSLSFLDGTWVEMAGRPVERWTFHEGRLEGEGLIINEGDTTVFERLEILSRKGVLLYTVKLPQVDSTIVFPLTLSEENSWTFENPKHDFPTSITYQKNSDHELLVSLKGNGRDVRFLFEKN